MSITSLLLIILALTLVSCSTTEDTPADIGTGTDDLKQSPCAQCDRAPFYVNGQWLSQ